VAAFTAIRVVAACRPDVEERESCVDSPRVIAIVSEPPEARPGEPVVLEAIVAASDDSAAAVPFRYALCAAPKPLTENNIVSERCLGAGVRPVEGDGRTAAFAMPRDACALFGPETPEPGFRPRDPDVTGGFYQPVRLEAFDDVAFARVRVLCALANAPVDAARAYAAAYRPNRNPRLDPLVVRAFGAAVALDAAPRDAPLELEVSWPEEDEEPYLAFDPGTQALVTRVESMRIAWYASGGELEAAKRTAEAVPPGEARTRVARNVLRPAGVGVTRVWVVVRDDRGGVAASRYDIVVR
jgi:hypothetical protein